MNVAEIQNAIRQQSEDLREELSELAKWEAEMKEKKSGSSKVLAEELPPVRGTAPLRPAKEQPKREDPIQVCKEQGNEYFRRSNFSEAIRMYSKGIDMDPHSARTHVLYANRAMCQLKAAAFDKAEKDATMCVQMNRTYVKGFFRRAMARKGLKKWKEAREDLETVLVLAPGDDEAQDEMAFVTEKLREQTAAEASTAKQAAAPAKRKKLVIEEVEDDEESEEEDEKAKHEAAAVAAAERTRVEQERVAAENREQERKRKEQAAAEEAARKRSGKANPRVEIVEEDDEEEPAPVAAAAPTKPAPKHADPVPSPAPTPAPAAPVPKEKEASPSPTKVEEKKASSLEAPAKKAPRERSLNNFTRWTKDNLKQPKSFAEFEKTYLEIRNDADLTEHYLLMVPFGNYKSLFGSSITSEIVMDFVKVAGRREDVRLDIMTSLSVVNRLEEVVMFLSGDETSAVSAVLKQLEGDGHNVAKLRSKWC